MIYLLGVHVPAICILLYTEEGNLCFDVSFEFNVPPRYFVSLVDFVLALKFLSGRIFLWQSCNRLGKKEGLKCDLLAVI